MKFDIFSIQNFENKNMKIDVFKYKGFSNRDITISYFYMNAPLKFFNELPMSKR